jgi:hypothetical protein
LHASLTDQQTTAANRLGRRQLRGVQACAGPVQRVSQLRHFHVTGLSQT